MIDYAPILADLYERRAALEVAIKGLEALQKIYPQGDGAAAPSPPPIPAPPSAPLTPAPRPVEVTRKPAASTKRCARPGCGEDFKPNPPGVGRPQRFCTPACAKKARQESEERIGATTAINRR